MFWRCNTTWKNHKTLLMWQYKPGWCGNNGKDCQRNGKMILSFICMVATNLWIDLLLGQKIQSFRNLRSELIWAKCVLDKIVHQLCAAVYLSAWQFLTFREIYPISNLEFLKSITKSLLKLNQLMWIWISVKQKGEKRRKLLKVISFVLSLG